MMCPEAKSLGETMPLSELLFSFKGRIRRLHWWVASLAVAAVVGVATSIIELVAKSTGKFVIIPETQQLVPTGPFAFAVGAIVLANMWINFALGVKRLHDRDRSGWWLLVQGVIMVLTIILVVGMVFAPDDQVPIWSVSAAAVGVVTLAITLWLFVEIGFLRRTNGPNRFGADPFGQAQADAAT